MTRFTSNDENGNNTNVNDANKIATVVYLSLTKAGFDVEIAAKYSLFCQDVYIYIRNNPTIQQALKAGKDFKAAWDIREGTTQVYQANKFLSNGAKMGLSSAADGFRNVRATGAATVLSASVDVFENLAKKRGIELNDCALSVTKVSLDAAGVAGGGLTFETGIGAVVGVMSFLALGKDARNLSAQCFGW